jgi:hypothetical protein
MTYLGIAKLEAAEDGYFKWIYIQDFFTQGYMYAWDTYWYVYCCVP